MPSETVPVHLDEWPYEKDALRERLLTLLERAQSEGKLNLSRLEGVTVPENLIGALRTFNAGYESDHAAAMRESVAGRMITTLRSGEIRGHIFFPVDAALQLFDPRAPLHRSYTYMFVHECAHVHDLDRRVAAMPGEIIEQPLAQPLSICLQVSWNEYAACRLAAYGFADLMETMRAVLRQAIEGLRNARSETEAAFAPTDKGRQNGITTALNAVAPLLQGFSYLLGHCRGLDQPLLQNVPENYGFLDGNAGVAETLRRLEQEFDALWRNCAAWSGFHVFDELIEAICALVKTTTGLHMERAEGKGLIVGFAANKSVVPQTRDDGQE
jgi:hypothetical protein